MFTTWSSVYHVAEVEGKVTEFLKLWWSVIDVHCPVKTVTVRRTHCPWLENDPQLRSLMNERDEAFSVWRRSRSPSDRARYRYLRNKEKGCLASSKRDFLCERLLSDRRYFWRNIREFAFRPAKEDGPEALAPQQADDFNRHFASVGPRIAVELAAGNPPRLSPKPPCMTTAGMSLKPVTLPELSQALNQLSQSKAVGHDGVLLYALWQCFPVIGPHILHLLWTSSRLEPHFSAITFDFVESREPNFRNERFRASGNFDYLGFLTPNKS